ncbi:citrate/2-methylcitrate synthase [Actinacidiphila paucisporea]|uniref:citrate synthase (unknown stereospecificity) n=1 Tax=Actinacidiphila paucisporea TaxID=310782 RepID=A0A1M7ARZ4_9ACTN|nr:citrate/2-methylcitrate synthase [Actinacidiphila paucisporea]SHL45532.1 citrate synthase [Actinacidiphila paucisporea]
MTDGAAGGDDARISTREAAARLGVKPETLYAYVSRGLLDSRRAAGGRGSTFDPAEVAALAARGRAGAGTAASGSPSDGEAEGWGRIRTGITLIDAATDSYAFRGVDAVALAEAYAYEDVAQWLWTGELEVGVRFIAPPQPLAAARAAAGSLPAGSGPMDRMRVAVIAAGAADPLRFDLTREAVLGCARGLIPTLVDALPPAGGEDAPGDAPIARRLWTRLTAQEPDAASLRVLDAALVLLIDHDLATSTLAVRVAASGRAHPYAAVSAGLGALDGPLHGQASALAHRMLADVLAGGAGPVVAAHLRAGQRVPGLGHRLYHGEDPRARLLLTLLADVPAAADALAAARDTIATAARHTPLHANVDLALAVLSVASGMPAEAGEAVFAVGRTAGWVAHALEEYGERALRLRPRGVYAGVGAPQPVPLPRG